MNIFIVDDNEKFRANLKLYIEGFLHHTVVSEASTGKEFINNINSNYDIILMDIEMPGMNGIETTKLENWRENTHKIIGISQHNQMINLRVLIEAGFKGFVSKINLYEQLRDAIREVSNGGYYFPDDIEF